MNRKTISGRARWRTLCALFTALIAALSLAPAQRFEGLEPDVPFADKIAHFLLYGAYAWVLWIALSVEPLVKLAEGAARTRARIQAGVIAYCLLYGGAMELLQGVLPGGRSCSLGDLLADGLGAAAAVIAARAERNLEQTTV